MVLTGCFSFRCEFHFTYLFLCSVYFIILLLYCNRKVLRNKNIHEIDVKEIMDIKI